jgi:phage tail sheath protein FI
MVSFVTMTAGSTVEETVTALTAAGLADYEAVMILDWLLIFDPVNNVQRYIAPFGPAGGFCATLAPQISPYNKQITGILGTAAQVAPGQQPTYSYQDIGLAQTFGISLIGAPLDAGDFYGFRTAVNTSANANPVTGPIEYGTLTNYIIGQMGGLLGQFGGQNQTTSPTDPLRAGVNTVLNAFFSNLASNGGIVNWKITCDLTNNTPQTIAMHQLFINAAVQYPSSVLFIFFQLQGGTTVNITTSVITGGQPV